MQICLSLPWASTVTQYGHHRRLNVQVLSECRKHPRKRGSHSSAITKGRLSGQAYRTVSVMSRAQEEKKNANLETIPSPYFTCVAQVTNTLNCRKEQESKKQYREYLPQSVDSATSCKNRAWRARRLTLSSLSLRKLSTSVTVQLPQELRFCPAAGFVMIHDTSSSNTKPRKFPM